MKINNYIMKNRYILIILAISIFIRGLLLIKTRNLPLAGDEKYYFDVAMNLVTSGNMSHFRPPLWGAILSLFVRINHNPFSARIASFIIGGITPLAIYYAAKEIFDNKTGITAAFLLSIYSEHIAFSHYLWSEILLTILILISIYMFFTYIKNNNETILYSSMAISGISLLAKEFTVITFMSFMTTLIIRKQISLQKLILCILIFLLPAITYSYFISYKENKIFFLSNSIALNVLQAHGIDRKQASSMASEKILTLSNIKHALKYININNAMQLMNKNIYNLWTPNSFLATRLLAKIPSPKKTDWDYQARNPYPIVFISVFFYVTIMTIGICGMIVSPNTEFRIFSISCIILLLLLGSITLLCSRFRLPFFFIFIIHSSYILCHPHKAKELTHIKNIFILLPILSIFFHIIYTKINTLGQWG